MSTDQWVEKHLSGVSPRSSEVPIAKLPSVDDEELRNIELEKKAEEEWKGLLVEKNPESNQVWHLPNFYTKKENRDDKIHRSNKYLANMRKRIIGLVARKEYRTAWIYGDILLRRSNAFMALNYIKADKGWFWKFTEEKNKEYMKRQYDINRKKLSALKVIRSYIPKPNGKMRPIGSPVQGDKAALSGLTEIVKLIIEPQIGSYQHGFISGKSMTQALVKVVAGILDGNRVFQFDLASFFNKVNVNLVCGRLNSLAFGLGRRILNITKNTFPRIKTWHPENEVTKMEIEGKVIWRKGGFTQGSPLSPILCNFALEFANFGQIKGLIQYADDGLILSKEKIENLFQDARCRLAGVQIADKAFGYAMRFKFLGIEFDLWNRTMTGQDGTRIRYQEAPYRKLLTFIKRYGSYTEISKMQTVKDGSKWYWKVVEKSLCQVWNGEIPPTVISKQTYTTDGVKVEVVNKREKRSNGTPNPAWSHIVTTTWGRFWYKPLMESTKGSRYLLDFYSSLKKHRHQQIADRDYDQKLGTEWWTAKKVGNKIWVIYPEEWLTYDADNKAITAALKLVKTKA